MTAAFVGPGPHSPPNMTAAHRSWPPSMAGPRRSLPPSLARRHRANAKPPSLSRMNFADVQVENDVRAVTTHLREFHPGSCYDMAWLQEVRFSKPEYGRFESKARTFKQVFWTTSDGSSPSLPLMIPKLTRILRIRDNYGIIKGRHGNDRSEVVQNTCLKVRAFDSNCPYSVLANRSSGIQSMSYQLPG